MYTLNNFYKSKEWQDLLEVLKLERLIDSDLLCEHCYKHIVNAMTAFYK